MLADVVVAAAQALQIDIDAIQIAAHPRNLRVEIDALLRLRLLSAEDEKSAAALATLAAALRHQTVEFGLLAIRCVFVTAHLLGAPLIAPAAAIDGGKLRLQPRAKRVRIVLALRLRRPAGAWRPRLLLRQCGSRAKHQGGNQSDCDQA